MGALFVYVYDRRQGNALALALEEVTKAGKAGSTALNMPMVYAQHPV